MAKKIKTIVLRTAGTNCDGETKFAFERSGAIVDVVHVNRLLSKEKFLRDYHILAIPGGFSYGDDIASGKILANELRLRLGEDIRRFIDEGKLILGICNGFQVLVKAGILPGTLAEAALGAALSPIQSEKGPPLVERATFSQEATLTTNDSARFEDRWVHLKPETSPCVWTQGIIQPIFLPVAHGEGKFIPKDNSVLERLKKNHQIVFRYTTKEGGSATYPDNPNGSVKDIAGICDETGRIFGLMPHPERHFLFTQHPFWTRLAKKNEFGDGAKIFENGIRYVKEKLL